VYFNIAYWIKQNWIKAAEEIISQTDPAVFNHDSHAILEFALNETLLKAFHYSSVQGWNKYHPYLSLATVKRAFTVLVQRDYLRKGLGKRRTPVWTLNSAALARFKLKVLEINMLQSYQLKIKRDGSKSNGMAQNQTGWLKIKRNGQLTPCNSDSSFSLEAYSNEAIEDRSLLSITSVGSPALRAANQLVVKTACG
jgi:hypothetical protein